MKFIITGSYFIAIIIDLLTQSVGISIDDVKEVEK